MTVAIDFHQLRVDIDSLVDSLANRLPPVDLDDIRQFNRVGEWTEAVEDLCATLVRLGIPVDPAQRNALAAVLETLGPQDDDDFPYINRKASTLAALNVEP